MRQPRTGVNKTKSMNNTEKRTPQQIKDTDWIQCIWNRDIITNHKIMLQQRYYTGKRYIYSPYYFLFRFLGKMEKREFIYDFFNICVIILFFLFISNPIPILFGFHSIPTHFTFPILPLKYAWVYNWRLYFIWIFDFSYSCSFVYATCERNTFNLGGVFNNFTSRQPSQKFLFFYFVFFTSSFGTPWFWLVYERFLSRRMGGYSSAFRFLYMNCQPNPKLLQYNPKYKVI